MLVAPALSRNSLTGEQCVGIAVCLLGMWLYKKKDDANWEERTAELKETIFRSVSDSLIGSDNKKLLHIKILNDSWYVEGDSDDLCLQVLPKLSAS